VETKEVAILCYEQGWRDRNLITMIAICGAESKYNPNFKDEKTTRYGLFGLNRLYTGTVVKLPVDEDEWVALACNPPQAAQLARKLYERFYFNNWLSYQTGEYFFEIRPALTGMSQMFVEMYEKKQTLPD
jgi:hypothetical protein